MAQLKEPFQVSGAGCLTGVRQIPHDVPLCGGQPQLIQLAVHQLFDQGQDEFAVMTGMFSREYPPSQNMLYATYFTILIFLKQQTRFENFVEKLACNLYNLHKFGSKLPILRTAV